MLIKPYFSVSEIRIGNKLSQIKEFYRKFSNYEYVRSESQLFLFPTRSRCSLSSVFECTAIYRVFNNLYAPPSVQPFGQMISLTMESFVLLIELIEYV